MRRRRSHPPWMQNGTLDGFLSQEAPLKTGSPMREDLGGRRIGVFAYGRLPHSAGQARERKASDADRALE